jgi:hypothetical protein
VTHYVHGKLHFLTQNRYPLLRKML